MSLVDIKPTQAVTLLHEIKSPWIILGSAFYNDYASLVVEIDGAETPHRLILRRDGTWSFSVEVNL